MDSKRMATGLGWGVVATVIMSLFMILGTVSGISPIPQPIPMAIAARLLGADTAQPLLMIVAVVSHLAYGGVWAAVLVAITSRVTLWKGIGLGVFLWFLMQLVVLPFLGWGVFGMAQDSRIAVATLILHLIYGGAVGWLADREVPIHDRTEPRFES